MNQQPQFHAPLDLPKQMFIGGQHVEALAGRRIETIDPATGKVFADFPAGDANDVDRAVRELQAGVARRVASDDADQSCPHPVANRGLNSP